MKKLLKIINVVFPLILYKWIVIIYTIFKRLCDSIKKRLKDKKEKGRRERRESKANCVPINSPVYYKPDPLIYSQEFLMKQGLAVTWDNPDIQLYKDNNPISSHDLKPNTEYEIQARIWNNSTEAPVVGMPVIFSFLSFGAGTVSNPIGSSIINLGVIGGSNNPNYTRVKWRTPTNPGHYCIQVKLDWTDDKNPYNNMGQENTNVVQSNSPANFTFKVRNSDKVSHKYYFEVDTYTIPKSMPCEEMPKDKKRKQAMIKNRNNKESFPIPNGWSVNFEPNVFGLNSNQEIEIKAEIIPLETFRGIQPFNINAFNDLGIMAGGITVYVEKK